MAAIQPICQSRVEGLPPIRWTSMLSTEMPPSSAVRCSRILIIKILLCVAALRLRRALSRRELTRRAHDHIYGGSGISRPGSSATPYRTRRTIHWDEDEVSCNANQRVRGVYQQEERRQFS